MRLHTFCKISCLVAVLALSTQGYAATKHTDKPAKPATTTAQTTDTTITEYIKTNIKKSKVLAPLKVNVTTQDGVVTLSGTVDADSEASSLIELAESVVGVKDVHTTELSVKESQRPFADMVITAKVKGLFIREDLFGDKDIASVNTSVETKDGVVYLTGIVDNKDQIKNAVEIIQKNVPEVKKVEYRVKKFISEEGEAEQGKKVN